MCLKYQRSDQYAMFQYICSDQKDDRLHPKGISTHHLYDMVYHFTRSPSSLYYDHVTNLRTHLK